MIGALIIAFLATMGTYEPAERLSPPAVLVGDSITAMNRTHLAVHTSLCGRPVNIHSEGARRMVDLNWFYGPRESGLTEIRRIREHSDPREWIIQLGSNDVLYIDSPAQAQARVDQILLELGDVDVTWVAVHVVGLETESEWINHAAMARGVDLVHWSSSELLVDFVHPSPLGVSVLGDALCERN